MAYILSLIAYFVVSFLADSPSVLFYNFPTWSSESYDDCYI